MFVLPLFRFHALTGFEKLRGTKQMHRLLRAINIADVVIVGLGTGVVSELMLFNASAKVLTRRMA